MTSKKQGRKHSLPKVIFGTLKAVTLPIPDDHILIVPIPDRWNDFGRRTKVEVYVNLHGHSEKPSFVASIGFLTASSEEADDVAQIQNLLDSHSELVVTATEATRFFTMLPTMKAYRELVKNYGVTGAIRILRAMRDLVVLNEFKSGANWLDLAARSTVFLKSFVRNSESYFAYKNAGSVLRGLENEESGRLSKSLAITFRLPGRENVHDLKFHFDHHAPMPKRIAVIIGKNGVGKSQTLARIASAALKGDSSLVDGETQSRPIINRLLAYAPTNEAKSAFPSDRQRRPRIWYRRFSLNRSERLMRGDGVSGLILQVARSDEHIKDNTRWEIFLHAIEAIHKWNEIWVPSVDGDYLPLRTLRSGGERSALENYGAVDYRKDPVRYIDGVGYPLSSGEISFLRFAAQTSLHIENGSLLLFDEPETHLHPNFISQMVLLLDNLLELTGSAAIIATHSVYFVREVFPAQVTVLRVDDIGNVIAERPRLRTFGADVGAISYFVFGEDEPSQLATRVEQRLLSKFDTWDALYSQYKDELSPELLGTLRDAMEAREQQ